MTAVRRSDLPDDFTFGVAMSAYQVEGAVDEDGRGRSIWDTFCERPGVIADASTARVACDHYHRLDEDLDLIARLGAQAYRFSIAWPRIQPDGVGTVNTPGLDFYRRLVAGLRDRDIEPVATLFHWDLPEALQQAGGWMNRDTASRFARYAEIVGRALGDDVACWITLNEPHNHMSHGHIMGTHAPGLCLGGRAFGVAHHQLLAHGLATAVLRDHTSRPVGITNYYSPPRPPDDDPRLGVLWDAWVNHMFTDPILLGEYPAAIDAIAGRTDVIRDGDLATIGAPIDILGVNYYRPTPLVRAPADHPLPFAIGTLPGVPVTSFGWPVVPDGLREVLVHLAQRYGERLPPISITENGAAYEDVVIGGRVDDPDRIAYLDGHLRAVADAIDAGVDVRGYFVWSLLDNFEWAAGFGQRFGIVHVDFETQVRTPKASWHWLQALIGGGPG